MIFSPFEFRIGRTVENRDIIAKSGFDLGCASVQPGCTLLMGGIHGDEFASIDLLESFVQKQIPGLNSPVVVIPLANPDGYARHSRYNAHGVDLNRNFSFQWHPKSVEPPGPEPWSEPETRALRDFIVRLQPAAIVSLHWALAEIDADGPQSTPLALQMWNAVTETERRPYRLRVYEDAGRRSTADFCPGSLGQWSAYGLRYKNGLRPSMVTLELPYDPDATSRPSPLPEAHLDWVRERWAQNAEGYLKAVEPGVYKMLNAAGGGKG